MKVIYEEEELKVLTIDFSNSSLKLDKGEGYFVWVRFDEVICREVQLTE